MLSPWRIDFPALQQDAIYLDSASSSQLPRSSIEAISHYLIEGHGNAHRGMHVFSERANTLFNQCKTTLAEFCGAASQQVVFTKSATESINLVARSIEQQLQEGDRIVVTELEHHANLLPWQELCKRTGATLCVLPLMEDGEIDDTQLTDWLDERCKLFAFSQGSNVLATTIPVEKWLRKAKAAGVRTLLDGAQAVVHQKIDFLSLGCDFYVFSAHKLYAATGVGVLLAKEPDSLSPLLLGGGIVKNVSVNDYLLSDAPEKLEAGSPNMVGIVSLKASIDYLNTVSLQEAYDHEASLTRYAIEQLQQFQDITLLPRVDADYPVIALVDNQQHSHDVISMLSMNNICIRAGHHCAQPLLNALGMSHCLRISIALYNDKSDIDALIQAWREARNILA